MNTLDPTDPAAAAEQLRAAEDIDRRLAGPVPSLLIAYGILCSAASSGVLTLHLTQDSTALRITAMATLMAWVGVGIAVPFMFRQPLRRGLGTRWGFYIAGWAVLWGLGTAVASTQLALVIAVSTLLLALFLSAAAIEAQIAKNARTARRSDANPA